MGLVRSLRSVNMLLPSVSRIHRLALTTVYSKCDISAASKKTFEKTANGFGSNSLTTLLPVNAVVQGTLTSGNVQEKSFSK